MTDDRHESEDQALDDPVFEELFAALRATARRPAPPMSPALTMLLAPGALGRRRRARSATVGLAVIGVLAGGVGAAAATGHLQRPAAVNRVADDSSGATTEPAPPTEAVTPPATDPEPEATGEDRTPDGSGDDETTRPILRPPTSDDDDSPGTEDSGSDEQGEHGGATEEGDDGDVGDDSGAQEPGDDEQHDEGDEVGDGSGEADGSSDAADVSDDGSEGSDGEG